MTHLTRKNSQILFLIGQCVGHATPNVRPNFLISVRYYLNNNCYMNKVCWFNFNKMKTLQCLAELKNHGDFLEIAAQKFGTKYVFV